MVAVVSKIVAVRVAISVGITTFQENKSISRKLLKQVDNKCMLQKHELH